MQAKSGSPRIEEFGISESDLASAPRLFLPGHRLVVIGVVYLVGACVACLTMYRFGHSLSAAVFFTIIFLAAGSVLLLPAVILAVCAGERMEERWLCRQVPVLRACLAYQRAAEEHRNRMTKGSRTRPFTPEDWTGCSPSAFRAEVASLLERGLPGGLQGVDREATGFDFLLDSADGRILVRCEPGATQPSLAVARELTASLVDHPGSEAWIVTATTASKSLADYIARRSISVVAPWQIDIHVSSLKLS